jgi:5-methyltetrahydrofolate--homocysteine methyltransferase
MALARGLSGAIMNPYSEPMMRVYHAHRALTGTDENCMTYLEFAKTITDSAPAAAQAPSVAAVSCNDLGSAILQGRAKEAAARCSALLNTLAPMEIVTKEIIPALDAVGRGFEQKTVYLPQLLMSAEAAQSAFSVIKAHVGPAETADKGRVILATVKGDIHDIGKNIVRLLLENYGFAVTDLGRDVAPETVLESARATGKCVVGLSALMTTTVPAMEQTIRLLHEELPHCRVMVGGAVLTADYAAEIGADAYAKDAMEAVRVAQELMR